MGLKNLTGILKAESFKPKNYRRVNKHEVIAKTIYKTDFCVEDTEVIQIYFPTEKTYCNAFLYVFYDIFSMNSFDFDLKFQISNFVFVAINLKQNKMIPDVYSQHLLAKGTHLNIADPSVSMADMLDQL